MPVIIGITRQRTLNDTDGDGVADPGETFDHVVIIQNTGDTDATDVIDSETENGYDIDDGSVLIGPIAFDDGGFNITGNTPMRFEVAQLLGNDSDPDGLEANLHITAVGGAVNGTVVLNDNGTAGDFADDFITFTPTTGLDAGATASFTYSIVDEDGLSSVATTPGTVSMTITEVVWYVDTTYDGSNGASDGSFLRPFTNLTQLNGANGDGSTNDDVDSAGETIFIYDRAAGLNDASGGITLEASQKLFGDAHAFTANGITIGATTSHSTIHFNGAGVTLATDNEVRGLDLVGQATGAVAIVDGNGTVGNLVIGSTNISGQGQIIDIDQGGQLNVSLGNVSSTGSSTANGGVIDLAGVTGTGAHFTVTGATTISGTHSQNAIDIGGAGTNLNVDFAGGTTLNLAGSNGVNLTTNAGSTSFANIDISSGTGAAFVASSAGTLTITGSDNDISTTTGQLLSLTGTTIGAGNVNLDTLATTGIVSGGQSAIELVGVADGDSGADDIDVNIGTVTVVGAGTVGNTSDGINIRTATSADVAVATATINNTTGDGIELNGHTGSFTLSAGNIGNSNDPTGDGVNVTGGTGTVTIAANITKTSGGGNVVEVDNHDSGNITFSGTLSATGGANNGIFVTNSGGGTIAFTSVAAKVLNTGAFAGVTLTNNSGATINFQNGALDIDTTSGTGFHATGGGTINVSSAGNTITATGAGIGVNLNNVTAHFTGGSLDIDTASGTGFAAAGGGTVSVTGTNNSINATSGSGLNINGTTIAAANVTFQRIDSGAGANVGISLVNTGTDGGLKVTGSGTAGSGGTINGKTGADGSTTAGIGIYLENTSQVVIDRMTLTNFDNLGIFGQSVNGIRLQNTTIGGTIGTSTGSNDAAVAFGTTIPGGTNGFANGSSSLFDNVDISGSIEHNVEIHQQSGTFNLTIRDSDVHDNSVVSGSDGILIETSGTAHGIIRIATTTFDDNKSQAVQANALGTSHLELTLHDNDVLTTVQGNEGFILQNGASGDLTVAVTNNTFSGVLGTNIQVGQVVNNATSAAQLNATISGNIMDLGVGGIAVNRTLIAFFSSTPGQNSQSRVVIDGNTIHTTSDPVNGIAEPLFVSTPDAGTDPIAHVQVTNNTVNITDPNQTALRGIAIQSTQDASTLFVDVRGNDVNYSAGAGAGVNGIRLRQINPAVMQMEPGVGGGTVAAALAANNPLSTTEVTGTVTFAANNNVVLAPSTPATPSLPGFMVAGTPLPSGDDGKTTTGGELETDDNGGAKGTGGELVPGDPGDSTTNPVFDDPRADDRKGPPPETAHPVIVDDGVLTQAELDYLVEAAIQRWIDAGATPEQVAAMRSVAIGVSDMTGVYLGVSDRGTIQVDSDGAGHGWFLDRTPGDDAEFSGSDGRLTADAGGAAHGRMDLLTVLMHELGHQVGLEDVYRAELSNELMYGYAFVGERRTPDGDDLADADPSHVGHTSYVVAPITIGGLPQTQAVQVVFTSTVNAFTNQMIPTTIVNASTVTFNPGGGSTTSANEALVIDTLTLGDRIFIDADGDNVFDAGEGVVGVTLTLFADTNNDGDFDDGIDQQVFADNNLNGVFDAGDTLATATTGADGAFSFVNLGPGNYIVRVDAANFGGGGALAGTVGVVGGNDPDDNVDNDDNGVAGPGGSVVSQTITLAYNTETTNGTGNDTNNTLDFGFVDINDAPVIGNLDGDDVPFTEGGAPVHLDLGANAAVNDADSPDFDGGSLTLTFNVQANDGIAFDPLSGVTVNLGNGEVSVDDGGGAVVIGIAAFLPNGVSIAFDADATQARVQQLIRSVVYQNVDAIDPSGVTRTFTWTLVDGDGIANGGDQDTVATTTVTFTTVNDPPDGSPEDADVTDGVTYTFAATDFTAGFSDQDGNAFAAVVITTLPATGSLELNGTAINAGDTITLADLTGNLFTYVPAPGTVGTSPTFTFQVQDNGGVLNGGIDLDPSAETFTLNIVAANAAPTIDLDGDDSITVGLGFTASYTEGDATGVAIGDTDVLIADADAGDMIESATIAIQAAVAGDELVLGAQPGFTVTGSGTDTILISGTGTAAQYQDMIEAVRFRNTSENPTDFGAAATRTINTSVNDGTTSSLVAPTTVNITATNDGPANTVPGLQTLAEDTANFAITGIQVSDSDAATLTVVLTVGNGVLHVDTGVVGGLVAGDITGNDSGSVTIVGSVTAINTTLAGLTGLTYTPTLNYNGPDTLDVDTSDLGATGGGNLNDVDNVAITVTAVNDAPAFAGVAGVIATEQTPIPLLAGATVSDVELDSLNGGLGNYAGATFSVNRNPASNPDDVFTIVPGPSFTVNGTDLQSGGLTFATINANANGLIVINFTSSGTIATSALVDEVIQSISYTNSSDDPPASVTLAVGFQDGGVGQGSGGNQLDVDLLVVNITAVADGPVAQDDDFTTDEATAIVGGDLFADNGNGLDTDPDGPPLAIVAVNGLGGNVDTTITLASGALLTVTSSGTFDYDPNGAFDVTPAPGSGASNTPASDSFTYTLAGGGTATVSFTITGLDGDDNLLGTAGPDTLQAGTGNDSLNGLGDNDVLSGGPGDDGSFGGPGNDVHAVDSLNDVPLELPGEGNDRVLAYTSFVLPSGSEIELLAAGNQGGVGPLNLTGNDLSQIIIGNQGANRIDGGGARDVLYGLAGNDVLVGGTGDDTMFGGLGDDAYSVDSAQDQVIEAGGQGFDRVLTTVSYTLGAGQDVELLACADQSATTALNLGGNDLGNNIQANQGDNIITGGASNDTLWGLGGNDTLNGGDGSDLLIGGAGADDHVFANVLGPANIDIVRDFVSGSDRILLDDAIFAALGAGTLSAGAFQLGTTALEADDRILYDAVTGILRYDADGSGAGGAVLFGRLDGAPIIAASDFVVI